MWLLTWTLACGSGELAQSRAELARLTQENSAQRARIAALEAEIEQMRPVVEAAKSLEQAAEREFSPPTERCTERDGAFTFDGDLAALARLELWARAARLVPMSEGAGTRVMAIRRDSLLSSCGFRNGDLLERVNGVALTSVEAWQTVTPNAAGELRFAVNRAGLPVEVVVRGP